MQQPTSVYIEKVMPITDVPGTDGYKSQKGLAESDDVQPETPTDVQDIHF